MIQTKTSILQKNIPLKDFSYYQIGGPADYFLKANSKQELIEGLKEWQAIKPADKDKSKVYFLGGGTNILFDDSGYRGLVIANHICHTSLISDTQAEFGAGLPFAKAVDFTIEHSLSGFEWAGGLPGSVGGAIRGNAGAFLGEVKHNVNSVESLNLNDLEVTKRDAEACQFGYRTSIFKTASAANEIILSGTFSFILGDQEKIRAAVQEKIDYRIARQPLDHPSLGSTFKNFDLKLAPEELIEECKEVIKKDPFPVIPAAHLLSEVDLKGVSIGGAQISEKHPNFILNTGGATAKDVLALISLAQDKVQKRFGILIEPEIMILKP